MREPSVEHRWYRAFQASILARNPAFTKLWEGVMEQLHTKMKNKT